MDIRQDQDMNRLMEEFHRGDISQAEYRAKRREILERMEGQASAAEPLESGNRGRILKHTIAGTAIMLVLLLGTIAIVKYLA